MPFRLASGGMGSCGGSDCDDSRPSDPWRGSPTVGATCAPEPSRWIISSAVVGAPSPPGSFPPPHAARVATRAHEDQRPKADLSITTPCRYAGRSLESTAPCEPLYQPSGASD